MASSFEILRGRDFGQVVAILHKVCGGDEEKLDALLRDELEVKLVERILKLVDKNGRFIPSKDLKSAVCDPDRKFYLVQPKLETLDDYCSRMIRFQEAFKPGLCLSVAEFHSKATGLIGEIKNNKSIANLLNGVYLPVILPRLEKINDYGQTLEQVFLPAVKSAYEKEFPKRKFYNWRENDLAGKVNLVSGMRHEKLLTAMTQKFVVAVYFPNPLQGFSVLASRELILILLESLLLAGGFDTAVALIMYPDIMARDYYTSGYDLSTLSWRSPVYSLNFKALVDKLCFDSKGHLGDALDYYSSGLLFLGSA